MIEANKTNLIIQGQGYLNTSIEWNDTANSTGGTTYSSSVTIFPSNFIAFNISFKVKTSSFCFVNFVLKSLRKKIYIYIYIKSHFNRVSLLLPLLMRLLWVFFEKRTQLHSQIQGLLEDKQWHFELQEMKLLSMDVGFMELKTHSMMTREDITLKNVSFKGPLISSLAMLDRSMMYLIIISILYLVLKYPSIHLFGLVWFGLVMAEL